MPLAFHWDSSSAGDYFDDGCCYYLGEPDVPLGINTLSCSTSIDLNLAREEEIRSKCAHLVPDPSPADRIRAGYLSEGNDGAAMPLQPKRKVQAGQEGGDLGRRKKVRAADHKKHGKKQTASKTVQKCSSSSSHCSDNESNCSQENRSAEDHVAGGGGNAKARAGRGSATDPLSLYAKRRREGINDRLRVLQKLVPNGTKVDISTMLEEAVLYVKFLQQQIKMLSSDELWMYAPIAYNGMSLGIDLRIPLPQ